MQVHVVCCLRDNYAYLVAGSGGQCVVVDPSEAEPVLAALTERRLALQAILNTHHHHDHVGGNTELVRRFPGIRVYGHSSDRGRIPEQTELLEHGDRFHEVGLGFAVRHIPGHTMGAVAYQVRDALFTGDTLFVAGCGRLFEGTPADMHRSLNQVLADVPGDVKVYCGHEYTLKNLSFAASIEPENRAVTALRARAAERLAAGGPSVPFLLSDERAVNPFLRCHLPQVATAVRLADDAAPVDVLAAVRRARDVF